MSLAGSCWQKWNFLVSIVVIFAEYINSKKSIVYE